MPTRRVHSRYGAQSVNFGVRGTEARTDTELSEATDEDLLRMPASQLVRRMRALERAQREAVNIGQR